MHQGRLVFSQIMDFIPRYEFKKCVNKYQGDYKVQNYTCWQHYLCMAFAQLTYRESLRELVTCLHAMQPKLYHMGFRSSLSRSTISDANEKRNWKIYAEFAHILIAQARELYKDSDNGLFLKETVYALDASTIDLCLSMFPWAHFRKHKAAIKLHTLLDLRGNIPSFIQITDGRVHEVKVWDLITPEPGSIYVFDRGYLSFERLYRFHQHMSWFVIRARSDMKTRRIYSRNVDKGTGLKYDQTVKLTGFYPLKYYPEQIRKIKYIDPDTQKCFVFLTNNFTLPAYTVTQIYKSRWQVELFFKWIKQHLRIKAFYGTSENAVKTQIWIAVSVYVLVAIMKKLLKIDLSLYTILQILSVSIFDKSPVNQLLIKSEYRNNQDLFYNQLKLFDL